jgi:hypothetical protein
MGFDINLADEGLHQPGDSPLWRESFWLDAYDQERNIGLIVYSHAKPVTGNGDVMAVVLLPDGRVVHDVHIDAYESTHEGFEAKVDGLRYVCTKPGSDVTFALEADELQFDIGFRANGPIYDYDWESWTHSRHYEQFGTVTGKIETAQGKLEFDGLGTRDHAWGARAKVPWRRWIWMTVRFESNKAWGVCLVDAAEPLLFGYISDDPQRELTFGRLDMDLDDSGKVTSAGVQLADGERELEARLKPLADVDRAGTDPTKKGDYDYYLVEVDDEEFGRGYGILDVFSTPEFDPQTAGPMEASIEPARP